jgi:hypothetical protein
MSCLHVCMSACLVSQFCSVYALDLYARSNLSPSISNFVNVAAPRISRIDVTASSAVSSLRGELLEGERQSLSARRHHPHIYRRLSNCPSLIYRALERCYSRSPILHSLLCPPRIRGYSMQIQSTIKAAQATDSIPQAIVVVLTQRY